MGKTRTEPYQRWRAKNRCDQDPGSDHGVPEDDLFRTPETWARRAFPSLIYFRQAERGGHFAAWEHPELFAAELRAAFTFLR